MEFPRLCRGGSSSLTFPGVHRDTPNVSRQAHERRIPMDESQSLNHTKWECKYHVVFIPKCRRRTLYVQLRRRLGEVFRTLAAQKESKIEEGHLLVDHVHM